MTHPVDRAAAIIAQEWGTFSTRDLCGHEIGIARALYNAGMLAADADLPDKWGTWRDRYTAQRKRAAELEHLVRVKKAENDALKKEMHALIVALDSDDSPTINDESRTINDESLMEAP